MSNFENKISSENKTRPKLKTPGNMTLQAK